MRLSYKQKIKIYELLNVGRFKEHIAVFYKCLILQSYMIKFDHTLALFQGMFMLLGQYKHDNTANVSSLTRTALIIPSLIHT